MNYFKHRWRQILPCGIVSAAFHLYFFFFIQTGQIGYLAYLDTLLLVPGLLAAIGDYQRFKKHRAEKAELMEQKGLVCRALPFFENQDIAEHDVEVLEEQLDMQFQENCDLQDYVAKWCHELKLPLAAALLMGEKIEDGELRLALQEQLEKMNRQIQAMLFGCRLQSPLLDLQIKKTELSECVKASVRNNRFFLIQKGFELTVEAEGVSVYTDSAWLVYILDQLLSNAIKYRKKEANGGEKARPRLDIWASRQGQTATLFIEDNGEGIKDWDIGRIFEKGFTGSNYHNGKYKSTGLGLYMVSRAIGRLGHEIHVESQYGSFTRFSIVFKQNPYFFR